MDVAEEWKSILISRLSELHEQLEQPQMEPESISSTAKHPGFPVEHPGLPDCW